MGRLVKRGARPTASSSRLTSEVTGRSIGMTSRICFTEKSGFSILRWSLCLSPRRMNLLRTDLYNKRIRCYSPIVDGRLFPNVQLMNLQRICISNRQMKSSPVALLKRFCLFKCVRVFDQHVVHCQRVREVEHFILNETVRQRNPWPGPIVEENSHQRTPRLAQHYQTSLADTEDSFQHLGDTAP